MFVPIDDDLDLEMIRTSGQCFRVQRMDNEWYRFIARDRVLFARKADEKLEVSCDLEEWESFWRDYFDLDRRYCDIRKSAVGKNSFIDQAMKTGEGLRILKQDPWEMIITFIISQRKNMPAIASAVEAICKRWGTPIETVNGIVHAFPTPKQLAQASEKDLRECSLGYRAPYIVETTRQVTSGEIDLEELQSCDDEELFERLQQASGVGPKVANCVALFGYSRTGRAPIDVWVARAIDNYCNGCNPFPQYGDAAGIMQQYVFYHMTHRQD